MKAHLLTVLSLLVYQARSQANQFSLQGTIKDAPVRLIYLRYTDQSGQERLDSAQIRQGRFSFRGQISQPTKGLLKTNRIPIPDEQNRNITPIYLEPRSVRVELVYNQFERIRVNGSKSQLEHEQLTAQQVPLRARYVALRDSLQNGLTNNPSAKTQVEHQMSQVVQQMRSVSYQFIKAHPASWVSASELAMLKSAWPIDSVRYLFKHLSAQVQQSPDGRSVAYKLAAVEVATSSVGKAATNFAATTLKGESISLSGYRGRYVLLDFWGSWCAPCRAGNPHLIELYERYRNKGIEFISVACDDKPDAWRKAIDKDGIGRWQHVMDEKQTSQASVTISRLYAIQLYPTKVLIDPSGSVLGRYESSNDTALDERLGELFK